MAGALSDLIVRAKPTLTRVKTSVTNTAAKVGNFAKDAIQPTQTNNSITALVIVPTRELAIQIAQHLEGFGYFAGISSIAVYGGGD